jgi:hypothetical protein
MNTDYIYIEDFKDAEETFENGTILSDRYNNVTYNKNIESRMRYEYDCLYCSPKQIKNIEIGSPIYMIEMNNNDNKIEGIGYLYNSHLINPPKIYSDEKYEEWNNYIYVGEYHITREEFNRLFPEILIILETKLFKGRGNQKRGKGFTKLSSNTYSENNFTEEILLSAIKETFVNKYF